MTPAEHLTEAQTLRDQVAQPGRHDYAEQLLDLARAEVHATLAAAPGTGTDYLDAEALLSEAERFVSGTTQQQVHLARAQLAATLAQTA